MIGQYFTLSCLSSPLPHPFHYRTQHSSPTHFCIQHLSSHNTEGFLMNLRFVKFEEIKDFTNGITATIRQPVPCAGDATSVQMWHLLGLLLLGLLLADHNPSGHNSVNRE